MGAGHGGRWTPVLFRKRTTPGRVCHQSWSSVKLEARRQRSGRPLRSSAYAFGGDWAALGGSNLLVGPVCVLLLLLRECSVFGNKRAFILS